MKPHRMLAAALVLSFADPTRAATLTVAAASDLKFAMTALVAGFQAAHPGDKIEVVYGSSGKTNTQIQQGAPYDLFFSADIAFPRELVAKGFAVGPVRPYAVGRLALWSATRDASKLTLADLAGNGIGKVAIANPQHAPYGQKAVQALQRVGAWKAVETKTVFGENIAQTAQFAYTGAADVGIVALSLALSPEMAAKGRYALVPDSLHDPLEQAFVVTARAKDNPLAAAFASWVEAPAARATLARFGFALPGTKAK